MNTSFQVVNARITATNLKESDHGILVKLSVKTDERSFSFGVMLGYNAVALREFVRDLLRVTRARCWEQLKGKCVRLGVGADHKVCGIGNFLHEEWIDPRSFELQDRDAET